MSEFKGVFAALPGVSCDRFTGVNLHSDQFFLSHCHADHMVGLDQLVPTLKRKNAFRVNYGIFCSGITKGFLVKKFKALDERFVREMGPNEAVVIDVFDRNKKAFFKLKVVAIPSNHCPGSVMFLFETMDDDARILYTGDFRFEDIPLETLTGLHGSFGERLKLDEVYLDTTFCSTNYEAFPSRLTALSRIWEMVHDWIKKNGIHRRHRDKHVVLFHLPAQYGSEAILRRIFQQSGGKWKIHVDSVKQDEYICTRDIGDCTSSDKAEAQWIHACSWMDRSQKWKKNKELPCQEGSFEVRHIRPCAMYFRKDKMEQFEDKVVKGQGGEYYKVCYSCHSSLAELREFVKYFQPNRIVPCAVPKGMTSSEVLNLLSTVLDKQPLEVPDGDNVMASDGEGSSLDPASPAAAAADPGYAPDSQMLFLETFASPVKSPASQEGRKRTASCKVEISPVPSSSKRQKLDDTTSRNDSSDDEMILDSRRARSRRTSFQASRQSAYSMPVDTVRCGEFDAAVQNSQGRRASLPHNLKIPAITITPSSPSPDPNHPDYPEFFEDKLYLETSKSTKSAIAEPTVSIVGEQTRDAEAGHDVSDDSVVILDGADSSQELGGSESTPDLDTILSNSKSATEKQNCLNYAKGLSRKENGPK